MDARVSLPFIIAAEAATTPGATDSWSLTAANYGVAGIMLAWFMWRDKLDRDERKQNHSDNLAASRRIENAFRTTTDSLIVGMSAMKSLDQVHLDLLQKLKSLNDAKDDT